MRIGLLVLGLLQLPACQPLLAHKSAPITAAGPQSEFGTLSPGQRVSAKPTPAASDTPSLPTVAVEPVQPTTIPASTQVFPSPVSYAHPEMLFPDQPARGPRPESPVVAAMQAHLDGRYAATIGHLAGFEKRNQELLLVLLPIIDAARTADLKGHDPKLVGLARQLDTAMEMVSRVAPLGLRKMTFATRVKKYGDYEPLPANPTFAPGALAMLYVEVLNAPSTPAVKSNAETGYVTVLDVSLELLAANNRVVEQMDRETGRPMTVLPFSQREFTRSPIRDHFLKIEFVVPEKPGKYTLTLHVNDLEGGRRVGNSVEFVVRAQ